MYANLKPFSLMGLPNKNITSSEKDLHATTKRDFFDNNLLQNKQETLLLRSEEPGKSVVSAAAAALKIRLPSRGAVDGGDGGEEDGWCTTPKTVDGGESGLPKCPPPPRKPKSAPSTKRKAQRVLLDLSNEIESLFPSNILRDFLCGKIKKVRTGCSEIL